MTPYKQIRALKKQLKPISHVSAKIRCERLVENMKIRGKIFNIEKKYTKQEINHQYLVEIKHLLHVNTTKDALKKVRALKNKSTNQQPQKSQQDITNLITANMKDYQKESANAVIPATNQECITIGKEAIRLICLKNSKDQLDIKDVLRLMKHRLDVMKEYISKLNNDSSSNDNPKGEPPFVPNDNDTND